MAVIGPEYEVAQQYGSELPIEPTNWLPIALLGGLLVVGIIATRR